MLLNLDMITWKSSEEGTNEKYYTQRYSNVYHELLVIWIMQERSMSILRGYLAVIFLYCLTQLKVMMRGTLKYDK